jgi:hypothetical protein
MQCQFQAALPFFTDIDEDMTEAGCAVALLRVHRFLTLTRLNRINPPCEYGLPSALWIIKCTGDLKSQAMTYNKDTDTIGLLAHCDKEFATATPTKLAQRVRHFLSHKPGNPQDIKEYNIKKKDQIRQLEEAGVDLHKVVAVVTYLENLPTEFDTFKAVRMMDEDLTIDDVMAGANDFYPGTLPTFRAHCLTNITRLGLLPAPGSAGSFARACTPILFFLLSVHFLFFYHKCTPAG